MLIAQRGLTRKTVLHYGNLIKKGKKKGFLARLKPSHRFKTKDSLNNTNTSAGLDPDPSSAPTSLTALHTLPLVFTQNKFPCKIHKRILTLGYIRQFLTFTRSELQFYKMTRAFRC